MSVPPGVDSRDAQEWPLAPFISLIDDGSECIFLDKAVVGGRRFGD